MRRRIIREARKMSQRVTLSSMSLKVEIENAKSMIEGYRKDGEHCYVSMFTAHRRSVSLQNDFRNNPKLITAKRGPLRSDYPLSCIGKSIQLQKYKLKNKYVAVLTDIFHIDNDFGMWEGICNSGAFDIWAPEAPFNSLLKKTDPMILMFRVYEADKEVRVKDGQYFDEVDENDVNVELIRPIIGDNDYHNLVDQIRQSIGNKLKINGHEVV